MAKTPSTMLALKTPFPHFRLPDGQGRIVDTKTLLSEPCKAVVVMFICNHCPYVKHISSTLASVTSKMLERRGVHVFAINSNDITKYPEDSPENMVLEAKSQGYQFPYLFDETQNVARSFAAACTPEFYLFDSDLLLAYRGQFDSSRPQSGIVPTGADLWSAFSDVLNGKTPSLDQKPSLGCNIKWKTD